MASEENSSEISKETVPAENTTVESQNNGQEEQEEDLQGEWIARSLFGQKIVSKRASMEIDFNLTFLFRPRDEPLGVGETRQGLT